MSLNPFESFGERGNLVAIVFQQVLECDLFKYRSYAGFVGTTKRRGWGATPSICSLKICNVGMTTAFLSELIIPRVTHVVLFRENFLNLFGPAT